MDSIVEAEEAAMVEMEPLEPGAAAPARAPRTGSGKLLSMKRYSDNRARLVTTPIAPRVPYERAAALDRVRDGARSGTHIFRPCPAATSTGGAAASSRGTGTTRVRGP